MTEQTHKILLLGDQAVALGAIHAGLSGVYAYPGTPSTEITEYIQDNTLARERNIFCRWCANEKRPWSRLSACLTWATRVGLHEARRPQRGC